MYFVDFKELESVKYVVDLKDVKVDWLLGTIRVKKDSGYIAQNICLAFVTSTLYLLVQPRPKHVEEEEEEKWHCDIDYKIRIQEMKRELGYRSRPLITPPFMKNGIMQMLHNSGWSEHRRIPSNYSIL